MRVVVIFGVVGTMGCGTRLVDVARRGRTGTPGTSEQCVALKKDAYRNFDNRDQLVALNQATTYFERLIDRCAVSAHVFVDLSRAYYLLAELVTLNPREAAVQSDLKSLYRKGVTAALLGVRAQHVGLYGRLTEEQDLKDVGQSLPPALVPALYWYVANYGKWAYVDGIRTSLRHRGRLNHLMTLLGAADANYFLGAIDRYWGAYYALAPSPIGGDLVLSQKYFESAIRRGPKYLGNKVLMAEFYAVKADDRELFDQLLKEAVEVDAGKDPSIAPENRIEQKRAQKLRAMAEELFE